MPKRKFWTAEEEQQLREMRAAGTSQADIGKALGRSAESVANRCQRLGIHNREAMLVNFKKGVRRVHNDPIKGRAIRQKISRSWTPERREQKAAELRALNAQRTYAPPSPEALAKVHAGLKAYHERRLAWCPREYREEYRHMVWIKRIPAAEARKHIEASIAADKARKSPFERQMEALKNGAKLIEKPVLKQKDYDFSLHGGSLS